MIDAAILKRHRDVASRFAYDPSSRKARGWTLSCLSPNMADPSQSLPPALRGDFLREYEQRRTTVTDRHIYAQTRDKVRPVDFEAQISRRLGWKAKSGQPTYIYWRHIPIARLEQNTDAPHIYISGYHAGGQRSDTRAMLAMNPLLDYLLTGVRLDAVKGVEIYRRHAFNEWPDLIRKPGVYIPVAGRSRSLTVPFWTALSFEYTEPAPVAYVGGSTYPVACALQLKGLI